MRNGELTIPYKTAMKAALVDSIRRAFSAHPDQFLAENTKVTLEFPTTENKYPAVVIKYFGRQIQNVGVGHREVIAGRFRNHYWYTGDIEFAIYALDPVTRDLIGDTLVTILTAGRLEEWSNLFFKRLYDTTKLDYPENEVTWVTVNTDTIQDFGETQTPTPWKSEDTFVYQASYRVGCLGEFYSLPPSKNVPALLARVLLYPYVPSLGETPPSGTVDPAVWQPPLES